MMQRRDVVSVVEFRRDRMQPYHYRGVARPNNEQPQVGERREKCKTGSAILFI